MKENGPDLYDTDLPPLVRHLADADTLQDTARLLERVLHGDSGSSLLPHRHVKEIYDLLPRSVREDVDRAVIQLLDDVSSGADWTTDASVELLLLVRVLFRSRAIGQEVLPAIVRMLGRLNEWPAEIVVAAGQVAIAINYHGSARTWRRMYEVAGDVAAPTVIGGLARTDWRSLVEWLEHCANDPWIERSVLNQFPALLVTHGADRIRDLANSVWSIASEEARSEIASFLARNGIAFDPAAAVPDTPQADWALIIHGLGSGELVPNATEAGGPEQYVRNLFVGRAATAPAEFREALNDDLTIPWRDSRLGREPFTSTILDLIRAFRPDIGAARVVEFLERVDVAEAGAAISKAFAAMAEYYEEAPARGTRDRLYARYVKVLKTRTFHPEVGQAALNALLKLNAVDTKDAAFAARIVTDGVRLAQVVDFAAAKDWDEKLLSWLVSAAVRASTPEKPKVLARLIASLRLRARDSVKVWWSTIVIDAKTITVTRELGKALAELVHSVEVPEGMAMYRQITLEE